MHLNGEASLAEPTRTSKLIRRDHLEVGPVLTCTVRQKVAICALPRGVLLASDQGIKRIALFLAGPPKKREKNGSTSTVTYIRGPRGHFPAKEMLWGRLFFAVSCEANTFCLHIFLSPSRRYIILLYTLHMQICTSLHSIGILTGTSEVARRSIQNQARFSR